MKRINEDVMSKIIYANDQNRQNKLRNEYNAIKISMNGTEGQNEQITMRNEYQN